ncbi:hypothetical protein AK830_g4444 [Neonectria ditissima]|uniref:Uncharacterized protein n=1 Tax=Neonectria ditissima TaxID=78410 RepID=A0A0P7BNE1_9HYPO|nr:hypothetical protein AK830_g4444 [Neonectria ditissima]
MKRPMLSEHDGPTANKRRLFQPHTDLSNSTLSLDMAVCRLDGSWPVEDQLKPLRCLASALSSYDEDEDLFADSEAWSFAMFKKNILQIVDGGSEDITVRGDLLVELPQVESFYFSDEGGFKTFLLYMEGILLSLSLQVSPNPIVAFAVVGKEERDQLALYPGDLYPGECRLYTQV